MKAFILILGYVANILASKCNELTAKNINTYVVSDSTVLIKDNTDFKPSVEVYSTGWGRIPNSYWIWYTADLADKSKYIVDFSKVFNVPGSILGGNIEYLADDKVTKIFFNGNSVSNFLEGSYITNSVVDIKSLLISGMNYINITAENINTSGTNPGGLCFLITVVSQVFI